MAKKNPTDLIEEARMKLIDVIRPLHYTPYNDLIIKYADQIATLIEDEEARAERVIAHYPELIQRFASVMKLAPSTPEDRANYDRIATIADRAADALELARTAIAMIARADQRMTELIAEGKPLFNWDYIAPADQALINQSSYDAEAVADGRILGSEIDTLTSIQSLKTLAAERMTQRDWEAAEDIDWREVYPHPAEAG